jgi:oligopeptide transport system permease protein
MTTLATIPAAYDEIAQTPPDSLVRRVLRSGRFVGGGSVLLVVVLFCLATLPLTIKPDQPWYYDQQDPAACRLKPSTESLPRIFGTDNLGRSLLARCLLGGLASLAIGVAAALISVCLGVTVGLLAGYLGGWVDALLMRTVDILYGLPYILLVILFKIAFEPQLEKLFNSRTAANFVVLFVAIGAVSWLTMARVVRGQVLALRAQPFIEAAYAAGLTRWRIFTRHLLPNILGPIIVYTSLVVPQAILQESFLSFLGIGIQAPTPTWGALASEGLFMALNPLNSRWWLLAFPCALLGITLLSLNFLGDGLRDVFDPRSDQGKL